MCLSCQSFKLWSSYVKVQQNWSQNLKTTLRTCYGESQLRPQSCKADWAIIRFANINPCWTGFTPTASQIWIQCHVMWRVQWKYEQNTSAAAHPLLTSFLISRVLERTERFQPCTILLLISWKWISHTFSTTSSFSKVTKPKPAGDEHTQHQYFTAPLLTREGLPQPGKDVTLVRLACQSGGYH